MMHMTFSNAYRKMGFVLLGCLATTLTATSAQAGFQWVEPAHVSVQDPNPVIAAPPVAPVFPPSVEAVPVARARANINSRHIPLEPLPSLGNNAANAVKDAPKRSLRRYVAKPTPSAPRAQTQKFSPYAPGRSDAAAVTARTSEIYSAPYAAPRKPRANSRVVLPDDAPDSVLGTIDPYPNVKQMQPVTRVISNAPPSVRARTENVYAAPPYRSNQAATAGAFADVVGFGSEVPLALALGQIVPAEYSYSFAPGINPGSRVSWDGGKPWNDVVSEMVAPLGYGLSIEGKTVKVTGQQYSQATPPYTPAKSPARAPSYKPQQSFNIASVAAPVAVSAPSIGTPIGGLPFEQSLIEPAAGNEPVALSVSAASAVTSSVAPIALEPIVLSEVSPRSAPIATTEESVASALEALEPVATPRRYRRNPGETTQRQNNKPAFALHNITKAGSNGAISRVKPTANWAANQGESLKETLARWSKQAGVQLVWDASHDFTLSSDIQSGGSFEEAIGAVFSHGLQGQDAPDVQFINGLGKGSGQVLVRNRA